MLQCINERLRQCRVLSPNGKAWSSQRCRVMRATFLFGLATGERADSMAKSTGDDVDYWRVADLVLTRDDREPSPERHHRATPYAVARRPTCDLDNIDAGTATCGSAATRTTRSTSLRRGSITADSIERN